MEIDGVATPYQRHVFWSALTNTCFLPSTVFPAAVGGETTSNPQHNALSGDISDGLFVYLRELRAPDWTAACRAGVF